MRCLEWWCVKVASLWDRLRYWSLSRERRKQRRDLRTLLMVTRARLDAVYRVVHSIMTHNDKRMQALMVENVALRDRIAELESRLSFGPTVIDQDLPGEGWRYEVFSDKAREWRFRLVAPNNEIVAVGEAYTRKSSAVRGVKTVQKGAVTDRIVFR